MDKFNTFYFESFYFNENNLKATFKYSFDKIIFFEEDIDFFSDSFIIKKKLDKDILNNTLFHLHIALWISYYKIFPTKKLIIKSWFLDEYDINFWTSFYLNGLWEFFIKNDFDFDSILNFENELKSKIDNKKISIKNDKSLLMWGGGKDSIVTSILLEEEEKDFVTFVFWKIDNIKKETLKVLWRKNILIKRKMSDNLFYMNKQWYYNWHVPITWIIAFVSVFSAYLYDFKNIILSNEKSASEENITWKWLKINHQYSKWKEFENDFRRYIFKNISEDINYYSKLSEKFEIEIAEIFSQKWTKYFKSFSSCNKNFKIKLTDNESKKGLWCSECEKCAFVYLILSPFLEEYTILTIFWENLLDKKGLINTYKWLFGFSVNKPFECVWTYEESVMAWYKTIQKYGNRKLPYILENLKNEILKNYEDKNK
jgi:hypothetical protein